MEVGTCSSLHELRFGDLNYLWSIIRHSHLNFFPHLLSKIFDPAEEKRLWMIQKLANEGWTPLPEVVNDVDEIYREKDLQKMLGVIKMEADPEFKMKVFVMLPFTAFPCGRPRYSLPIRNNIPRVVRYICVDFTKTADVDISEFSRVVKEATKDGWKLYEYSLTTPTKYEEFSDVRSRSISWKTESSKSSKKRKYTEFQFNFPPAALRISD